MNILEEKISVYKRCMPAAGFIACKMKRDAASGDLKPWVPYEKWKSPLEKEKIASRGYEAFDVPAAAFAIMCGKYTNISILDFDDMSIFKEFEEKFGEVSSWCNFVVTTPHGGKHCFFAYSPRLKHGTPIKGLDIRNDGGMSWAAPTNEGYAIDFAGELAPIPSEVEEYVSSLSKSTSSKSPNPLFEEKKVYFDFSYPLRNLVEKIVEAGTIAVFDDVEKRVFLSRLFEGSEAFFKEATKKGMRNNLSMKLYGIFGADLTIDEDFFWCKCVEFVDIFIAPEEGGMFKAEAWWNEYGEEFVYDENWRTRIPSAVNACAKPISFEEKQRAVRATSSMIDAMFEANSFAGYSMVQGKYFLCKQNVTTKEFELVWLAAKDADKINPFLAARFEIAADLLPNIKSFSKACPIVENVIRDEMQPFGFFYDRESLLFNSHYNSSGREPPVALWERKFKTASLEEVEKIEVSPLVRKLIYHPIAKEEHTDYYLASLGEKLCDIFQVPMKHHHITSKTQGTGKSFLTTRLLKVLFGAKMRTINSGALYSQFNGQHANVWAVTYDDVEDFDKHCSDILKNYVGNSFITIHSKNKEPYEIENHIFSAGSSNHSYPAKVSSKGERRLAWYPGREEMLNTNEILGEEYSNVEEFMRDKIEEIFALIRSAQLRLKIDYVKPFNEEGMAELAELSNESKIGAVAHLFEKAAKDPSEENFEKLDLSCDESMFTDIGAFVELVKTTAEGDSKTYSRKDIAASMKRWAAREFFRELSLNGHKLAMRHSKRHGRSVYGICLGEEDKNIFNREISAKPKFL